MNTDTTMQWIFQNCKTIAVVGLSAKLERPSHYVSAYLQAQGYRIIPVNPGYMRILGEPVYACLADVPAPLDWVLCFRRSADIPAIAQVACTHQARALWMQQGIENGEAAAQCRAAGLRVVEDRCAMVEHRRWLSGSPDSG